ncbi:hypothetical protein ACH5RR_038101 [Cinchona calisaya]|uniref:Reverse transcriptase n=1 Tax=Cinchona calisaya TaxID=153742 RepID=A0ABD2Y861_9GENT
MEYLSIKKFRACDNRTWNPIKICNGGPSFSHCLFVDDIVLFSLNTASSIGSIKAILDDISKVSGLNVSVDKNKIFFSKNTPLSTRTDIFSFLNIAETDDLGLYLGFPICKSKLSYKHNRFILEKVRSRLAGWQTNLISLAGRNSVVQQVSSSIPSYYMQCATLPLAVCDELDKINRRFLWGASVDKLKISLTSWDRVICSKQFGGLGIRSCRALNEVALAKLNWKIL